MTWLRSTICIGVMALCLIGCGEEDSTPRPVDPAETNKTMEEKLANVPPEMRESVRANIEAAEKQKAYDDAMKAEAAKRAAGGK